MTGHMTGTAIKRLILQKIKAALVPFAPLPEQRRIVAEIEKQFTRLKRHIQRLRRDEGLRVPPTKRKLVRRGVSTGLPKTATHRNHVWTWDFIADATVRGGALRMLTIGFERIGDQLAGVERAAMVFIQMKLDAGRVSVGSQVAVIFKEN